VQSKERIALDISVGPYRLSHRQICGKWTSFAVRDYRTMLLANRNCERMKLVEEPRLIGDRILRERLACQLNERFISLAISSRHRCQKTMALRDPAQILIGNWNGVAERVQQNGIGSLATYAGQG
jgi:hypothetical protein